MLSFLVTFAGLDWDSWSIVIWVTCLEGSLTSLSHRRFQREFFSNSIHPWFLRELCLMLIEVLFKSPYIHFGSFFFQFIHFWATLVCPWKNCPLDGLFRPSWGGWGMIDAVCIQRDVGMESCSECAFWFILVPNRKIAAVFFFQENSRVPKQIFIRTRDVTSYFILSPGTYSVVPAATEDQEFEFLLRIFIKNHDYNE